MGCPRGLVVTIRNIVVSGDFSGLVQIIVEMEDQSCSASAWATRGNVSAGASASALHKGIELLHWTAMLEG